MLQTLQVSLLHDCKDLKGSGTLGRETNPNSNPNPNPNPKSKTLESYALESYATKTWPYKGISVLRYSPILMRRQM